MKVVALVISVDEAARLRTSLPALAGQALDEVVVVDDACTDDSAAVAAAAGARVVRLERRVSWAAAVNAGLAACRGDAVLLLNADCVLRPGAVGALAAALGARPGVAAVAPKLLRPDGRIDTAGVVVTRWRRNGLVGHGAPGDAYATAAPCFGGDGACVLLRRAALAGGEVLDEALGLWVSESDLAWRLQLAGWAAWYEPAAVGEHPRTLAPGRAVDPAHRRLQFRNRLLCVLKDAGARDLPWALAFEVAALSHALLRERVLLDGYRDAWRARGAAWRRRQAVARRARPPFGLTAPR